MRNIILALVTLTFIAMAPVTRSAPLNFSGPIDLDISAAGIDPIALSIYVNGDLYVGDSGVVPVMFDITLTAANQIFLGIGAWPHAGAPSAAIDDALQIDVVGDTIITPDLDWTGATINLVATGDIFWLPNTINASNTLTFHADAEVSVVPLPAAWLLMVSGLGVAGFIGRKRRA